MSTNLYEVLELTRDATPEQIRKAYKKRALQTHPDRLPAGSTPDDKATAEEQFRKVNNAYEVLIDPQNRKLYDMQGVWPPPDPQDDRRHHHHHHGYRRHHRPFGHHNDDFSDPFFDDPFSRMPFSFTDPFVLFDTIFGDMHRHGLFHHPGLRRHTEDPFFALNRHPGGLFGNIFDAVRAPPGADSSSRFMHSEAIGVPGNGWTQEVRRSSTVNGVTQSMWKRRDADGNVHVGRTHPDGREIYTVEQPPPQRNRDNRYIGLSFAGMHRDPRRSLTMGPRHDYAPPPHPPPPANGYDPPPPPYPSSRGAYQPNERHHHHYHHPQNPENGYPVVPDTARPRPGGLGLPWKPRWWSSGS